MASQAARLPLPAFLRGYRRTWLTADVLAAVTLLVIAVPEQLATSRLAQMPPVTGLYAFVAGSVVFALLGANPQLSVGADSTIAPLFAAGIGHLAPPGGSSYVALVGLMSVAAGVLVAAVGLLRLGWIAEFLSTPIITGFLAGVAVIIVVHQLPDLFGLPSAGGSTIHRVATVVRHLGDTDRWTLGIGLGVFALVLLAERVDRRLPGALVALVAATVLVAAGGLATHHGVAVLGAVAHHPPHVGVSHLSWPSVGSVLPIAAVVALVVVSQTAATSRAFADRGGYESDLNRDFRGAGAGSVLAGLFGAFAVNASPGRTGAVANAGGRTQLTSLLAAGATVAIVPAAGLLKDVPDAALAGVLLFIAVRIFHVRDLVAIGHFDRWELGLALVTLMAVPLWGVEQGIGVAVGLAILDRTRISTRPSAHVLERIPGTTSWRPLQADERPEHEEPGVLALLFAAPVYFATADRFRSQVEQALATHPAPVDALVLDLAGMHDIDFTGARAFRALLDSLERRHVRVAIARAGGTVQGNLERAGLLQRLGADRVFDSVDEAVEAMRPGGP